MTYPEDNSVFTFDTDSHSTEATLKNGTIVRVWSIDSSVPPEMVGDPVSNITTVYVQQFDTSGLALGEAQAVISDKSEEIRGPSIAALDDGGFLVGWSSVKFVAPAPNSDLDYDVQSKFVTQRFDAAGVEIGDEHIVTQKTGAYISGYLDNLADGIVLQYWTTSDLSSGRYSSYTAFGQVLDANAEPLSDAVEIGYASSGFGFDPFSLVRLAHGGFATVSKEGLGDFGDEYGIAVAVFDNAGSPIGERIIIPTGSGFFPVGAHATALTDGNFIVRWQDGALLFDETGTLLVLADHPIAAENHAPVFVDASDEPLIIDLLESSEHFDPITLATDADGDAIVYSIVGGADADKFGLTDDGDGNRVLFITQHDFENPADSDGDNVYEVVLRASDKAFAAYTDQSFQFRVNDVNEAPPVITSNGGGATASLPIAESTTTVTTVQAESAFAIEYAIVGGTDRSLFQIDAATGALRFKAAPDFEAPADAGHDNVYDVVVRATSGSLTDEQALAIHVTDVNDNLILNGTNGNDVLRGGTAADTLNGGKGNDMLNGGRGSDVLAGGKGKDLFQFDAATVADGIAIVDRITDFNRHDGDKIDLSAIDAKTATIRNDKFKFIDTRDFSHHAGEVRFDRIGSDAFVQGDINGDGNADFAILIKGIGFAVTTDFIL